MQYCDEEVVGTELYQLRSHFLRRVVIGCAAIARVITLRQRNNATNARRRGRLDREGTGGRNDT